MGEKRILSSLTAVNLGRPAISKESIHYLEYSAHRAENLKPIIFTLKIKIDRY